MLQYTRGGPARGEAYLAGGYAGGTRESQRDLISLVVPFHNEAAITGAFFDAVVPVLQGIPDSDY